MDDFDAWAEIRRTWLSRKPLHGQYTVTKHDMNSIEATKDEFKDEDYAINEASHLLSVFDKFEETLIRTGPDSELMLSSVNRIREILKVCERPSFPIQESRQEVLCGQSSIRVFRYVEPLFPLNVL